MIATPQAREVLPEHAEKPRPRTSPSRSILVIEAASASKNRASSTTPERLPLFFSHKEDAVLLKLYPLIGSVCE